MPAACPRCRFAVPDGGAECPRCGVLFGKLQHPRPRRPRPAAAPLPVEGSVSPDAYDPAVAKSLAVGLGLALLVLVVPFFRFVIGYLTILIHELGHAATGWLFGYPSVPAFDFRYGGGVTCHEARKLVIVLLVLGALAYGLWTFRARRHTVVVLGTLTAVYALLAFTWLHEALITFMGHGAELIFAGIFLYRAMSGSAIKIPVERPLYAFVGFFIVLDGLRFAWNLIHDPFERLAYEEAKGGGHWMDFSVLAEQHFHVDLATVAGVFSVLCLVTVPAAWLVYRHERSMVAALVRLRERSREREQSVSLGG